MRPPRRDSSATCAPRIASPGTSRRARTSATPTCSATSSARRPARSSVMAVGTPLCTIMRRNRPDAARRCTEQRHQRAARRLAEERDVPGVATEGADLVAYPLRARRRDRARPSCRTRRRRREFRVREKAERAEAVVDGDDHDIAARGEHLAAREHVRARTLSEPAAVDPHHDRPLRRAPDGRLGRPYVE